MLTDLRGIIMTENNNDLGDFIRPRGVDQGILINSNNQALQAYKKAKQRFNKLDQIDLLEDKVNSLSSKIDLILQRLQGNNNNGR